MEYFVRSDGCPAGRGSNLTYQEVLEALDGLEDYWEPAMRSLRGEAEARRAQRDDAISDAFAED